MTRSGNSRSHSANNSGVMTAVEIRASLDSLPDPRPGQDDTLRRQVLATLDELAEEMIGRQHEQDLTLKRDIQSHLDRWRRPPTW